MKTPKEIKKGLEYLSIKDIVKKLDMWKEGIAYDYAEDAALDALSYILQLEEKVKAFQAETREAEKWAKRFEQERDAAKRDMQLLVSEHYGPCEICNEAYCEDCNRYFSSFEWRGPCEENGCTEP